VLMEELLPSRPDIYVANRGAHLASVIKTIRIAITPRTATVLVATSISVRADNQMHLLAFQMHTISSYRAVGRS
jgi:hypothetical protein